MHVGRSHAHSHAHPVGDSHGHGHVGTASFDCAFAMGILLNLGFVVPGHDRTDGLLRSARAMLHARFGIGHSTIQIKREHQGDAHC